MGTLVRQVRAIVWKDLLTELRTREVLSSMLSFAIIVQVIANVITIAGQLYVAILIALILGRVQKRLT